MHDLPYHCQMVVGLINAVNPGKVDPLPPTKGEVANRLLATLVLVVQVYMTHITNLCKCKQLPM